MPKLTYNLIHEILYYNKFTGYFFWKINLKNGIHIGDVAGYKDKEGYIVIGIDGKTYKAHRLAWLYVHGYMPELEIDHRDQIPWHNWIENLRETSNQCNIRNTGNPKCNTSGVKGVYWYKASNKWKASITVNLSLKFLGYYKHFHNAVCARLAAEQCLDWEGCDTNSPAYQYVKKIVGGC